ncbi:hypothetical protein ACFWR9_35475 [Streptomyces sp. NPDC058534]|uniref:hypothetical protein n=1 Tax=Streptomyces sp. NPDC058534 TaxID=3346541 RepID=UPI00365B5CBA
MDVDRDAGARAMLTGLLDASHLMLLDALPDTVGRHARAAGFTDVRIYVADLGHRSLHLLTGPDGAPQGAEKGLRIEGTSPGRAYQ